MASMVKRGLDPRVDADVARHADIVLQNYYKRTLAALREVHPMLEGQILWRSSRT